MPILLTPALRLMRAQRSPSADKLRDDSGQSMIELAVVLPAFFLLTLGLVNFCMVIFGLGNISYASRQADRYACLHSSTSLSPVNQTTINTLVAPFLFKYPSNTYSSPLTYTGSGNVVGGTATVTVNITYTITLPFKTTHTIALSSSASGTITQ